MPASNSRAREKVTNDFRKASNFEGLVEENDIWLQRFRIVLWQNCLNSTRRRPRLWRGEKKNLIKEKYP